MYKIDAIPAIPVKNPLFSDVSSFMYIVFFIQSLMLVSLFPDIFNPITEGVRCVRCVRCTFLISIEISGGYHTKILPFLIKQNKTGYGYYI